MVVVDGLAARKTVAVKNYIASTKERLTMHVLPGYAPDLNPENCFGAMSNAQELHETHCVRARSW
ncbi:MAG TPA: hypothetical protein DCP03_13705 [Polaromonas sp.]|nr:hypothetical protein [Polaromonas sp.]